MKRLRNLIWLLVAFLAMGCAADSLDDSAGVGSATVDERNGAGMDADEAASMDADTDSDADADADIGGEPIIIPEQEQRTDYRKPVSSGGYVFIADAASNQVVAVDSATLVIHLVDVGVSPTHVVALDDAGTVAALNVDSDEVSIIRLDADGQATVVDVPVRPWTNALKVSPDGRYVVAFWDDLFQDETGVAATDQEITIIDTMLGKERAYDRSIGLHPSDVVFDEDDARMFVLTESGINVIDLSGLDAIEFPPSVRLFDYTKVAPDQTETVVDPFGTVAIGRTEDSNQIQVVYLDGHDEQRTYTLTGIPTDLDVAADGSFGILAMRYSNQVAVFDLPLPDDATVDPFTYYSVETANAGSVTLSADGRVAALYTTVSTGDITARKTLTVMEKEGAGWRFTSQLLPYDIDQVVSSPTSNALVAIHDQVVTNGKQYFGYTLVALPQLQYKGQLLPEAPLQILIAPDGSHAYFLQKNRDVDVVNLASFIVDTISLGSTPVAAGYATLTDKVFVAQDHPSGRMSFMDADGSNIRTVTGYTLNNQTIVGGK